MFAAGDIVAGKFKIDHLIGRGGMGLVVAATHVHLGQRVALKFLLPEYCSNQALVGYASFTRGDWNFQQSYGRSADRTGRGEYGTSWLTWNSKA